MKGLFAVCLALGWWAAVAGGQAPPVPLAPPPPGPPDHPSGQHTMARAGCPQCIACYAHPSDTGSYVGYYVGGGAPCLGQPRCATEGTWGWDYQGWLLPRRVILGWWHGRRSQGGVGYYRTVPTPNCASPSTP